LPGSVGPSSSAMHPVLIVVAELESRLAGLTPTDSNGRSSSGQMNPGDLLGQPWLSGEPAFDVSQAIPTTSVNGASGPMLQNLDGETADNPMAGMGTEFDFGDLFLVPANWPKNLPSPCQSLQPVWTPC
jgi:hypothetical protein